MAQVIPDSGEDVIVIKTNAQNYDDFVAQITALLSREFGDNYLFRYDVLCLWSEECINHYNVYSLVADSPVDVEKSIDRQILQTAETDLGATLPRNGQFPVFSGIFLGISFKIFCRLFSQFRRSSCSSLSSAWRGFRTRWCAWSRATTSPTNSAPHIQRKICNFWSISCSSEESNFPRLSPEFSKKLRLRNCLIHRAIQNTL